MAAVTMSMSVAKAVPAQRSAFAGKKVTMAAPKAAITSRRSVLVKAEDEGKIGNPLSTVSTRSGLGFTEEDSAGQSNIFSVEPRVYVAGSAADDGTPEGSAQFSGVVATVAGLLLAFGIRFLQGANFDGPAIIEGDYEPLSYYVAKFSDKPAPAPAPVAPEVASE